MSQEGQTWPEGSPERRAVEAGIGRAPTREWEIGPVTRAEKAEENFARFVAALRRMAQFREDEGNDYIASCQRAAINAAFEEIAEKR